ncbi:hypothetical protein KM043_002364 [Ampulex compressa]|nr:hypothetical protein KM043_002364 [Ampulex compressa]
MFGSLLNIQKFEIDELLNVKRRLRGAWRRVGQQFRVTRTPGVFCTCVGTSSKNKRRRNSAEEQKETLEERKFEGFRGSWYKYGSFGGKKEEGDASPVDETHRGYL